MNIQGFERGFFCHHSSFFKSDVLRNLHDNLRQKRILTYPNETISCVRILNYLHASVISTFVSTFGLSMIVLLSQPIINLSSL